MAGNLGSRVYWEWQGHRHWGGTGGTLDEREGVDEKNAKKCHKKEGAQPKKVMSPTQILLCKFFYN